MLGRGCWASTPVLTRPLEFSGEQGGADLCALITSGTKVSPCLIVSGFEGLGLPRHRRCVCSRLGWAFRLWRRRRILPAGLLPARWVPQWSCYNGALRIIWPFRALDQGPFPSPALDVASIDGRGGRHGRGGTTNPHAVSSQGMQVFRRSPFVVIRFSTISSETIELKSWRRDEGKPPTRANSWPCMRRPIANSTERTGHCESKSPNLTLELANAQAMLSWVGK